MLFLRLRDAILGRRPQGRRADARGRRRCRRWSRASLVLPPGRGGRGRRPRSSPTADPAGDVGGVAGRAVGRRPQGARRTSTAPVVILGRPSLAESADGGRRGGRRGPSRPCPEATFLVALRRGNVRGALDLGLAPGLLPGRVGLDAGRGWFEPHWGKVPGSAPGMDTTGMLDGRGRGPDPRARPARRRPAGRLPRPRAGPPGVDERRSVIAVDTFLTESSRHATVVLAAAGYGEKAGTTTNIEGRVTGLGQKVVAHGTAWADWMIASELARRLGGDLGARVASTTSGTRSSGCRAHHNLSHTTRYPRLKLLTILFGTLSP